MKSTFAEMSEFPEFQNFILNQRQTENYFAAASQTDEDQRRALEICLAYAFKAGVEFGRKDGYPLAP